MGTGRSLSRSMSAKSMAGAAERVVGSHTWASPALQEAIQGLTENGMSKSIPESLEAQLVPATNEFPEGLQLDPSQLEALSEAMQELLKEQMDKLAAAGLLDASKLGKLGKLGELGELGDLGKFKLHECTEDCKKEGGT